MLRDRITVLFLGDVTALVVSFFVMLAIRFGNNTPFADFVPQYGSFLVLLIVWLVVFFIFDLYNVRRVNPNPRTIGFVAIAIATSALLSTVFFYIFPANGTPKTNLAVVSGIALVLLIAWRRLFYRLYTSRLSQYIGIFGSGPAVEALTHDIARHPQIGKIMFISEGHADMNDTGDSLRLDLIISHGVPLEHLFETAQRKESAILSLTEAYEELFGKVPLSLMTEEKAMSVFAKGKNVGYRAIERLIECVIALLVLIVASPFLLIASAAILIEDGRPVLFRQTRIGKNGVPFSIFKLRTMKALAPDGSAELNGSQWADKRDSRVTCIGRILRKTHLDEVPQMINLLKGDIALIGPRPERPAFVEELERTVPYYFLRHTVKPGFTGWAQIKFRYARSALDSREKFEYDLYYLFKKNPLLDLGIFLKTIHIIFTH